jgi:hypothetical protein
MTAAYLAPTLTAIVANGFSGVAALFHFRAVLPGMARAGVPESWVPPLLCPHFGLANGFLALNTAALVVALQR